MAKLSKTDADYTTNGTNAEHCGICNMFRRPDECTAVAGTIRPSGWCRLFEKKSQAKSVVQHKDGTISLGDNWEGSPYDT